LLLSRIRAVERLAKDAAKPLKEEFADKGPFITNVP
jgi:hypothetical protein